MKTTAFVLVSFLCLALSVSAEDHQPAGDSVLVLKNGAEARGFFVGLKDGLYTLRLHDGRTMTYPVSEVERIEVAVDKSAPQQGSSASTNFSCTTFVSEKDLDKTLYTTLKDIKVSKKWYGSTTEMYGELAEEARKAGADGVINVHTWHAPSGFSWAAPHAGGMAIKWTPEGRTALPKLDGRCY